MDYQSHRPMTIPPPPMPMHNLGSPSSSLPISGERLSVHLNPAKKQRLMLSTGVKLTSTSSTPPEDQYTYQAPTQGTSTASASFRLSQQQGTAYNSFDPTQQPFITGVFDYSHPTTSSRAPPPVQGQRNVSFPGQPRPGTLHDHNQQGIYQQLMRHQQLRHISQSHHPLRAPPAPDLFSPFLGENEHLRHAQGSQNFGWPVHGQGTGHRDIGKNPLFYYY